MRVAEAPPQLTGWEAEISLGFEAQAGRTVLAHRRHRGPLAVQKPFYPEPGVCHIYLLHPPGGLVAGDRVRIEVTVGAGGHVLITTPGANKYYRSDGLYAVQDQRLAVAATAALEWLPQETILFAHCRAVGVTRVSLEPGARFIGWEVCCFGRPAAGEHFAGGSYAPRLEIWRNAIPLMIERARIEGGADLLQQHYGLMGHTVIGTLAAVPADETMREAIRDAVPTEPREHFSVTLLQDVLVCRYLGDHAEAARCSFANAWSALRPLLLGRPACPPRIWRT